MSEGSPVVLQERIGSIVVVSINRPNVRNAVDRPTAEALTEAFRAIENDPSISAAVLTGVGGNFCAGADLKAISTGNGNRIEEDGDGPMGPSRMFLSKPVIAAIEGYAVAGGLELALWCDLRVVSEGAILGVFCRRFGVPLIDGGTIRLPRLIGLSRALDLILTGRPVPAEEAREMGLVNRVVKQNQAKEAAIALAQEISAFPQVCMQADRRSAYENAQLPIVEAIHKEFLGGLSAIQSGETQAGASQFTQGKGKHAQFSETVAPKGEETREGGCHCGAVRFRVLIDKWEAIDCNCSICTKKGFLHYIVPPEKFSLLSGRDKLTTYTFQTRVAKHTFCSICGMHAFYTPRSHPDHIDVNIRCLDGDTWKLFSIRPFNGKEWEENIEQIR